MEAVWVDMYICNLQPIECCQFYLDAVLGPVCLFVMVVYDHVYILCAYRCWYTCD